MIKNESIKELSYRLARQHLPGSFKDIEPITGKGEVNQVYLISTTQLTAVLRVNELIEYDRFRKERWCSETATEHGVPGPRVIATGKDKNCAYMLLEFIDGKNGKDIDSTLELWQTLGQYLKMIHKIPVKGFGERIDDILNGNSNQWKQYVNDNIVALNDSALTKIVTIDNKALLKLQSLFTNLLAKNLTFGLNHGDFSLANVIIDKNNRPHIIDWGSAQAHVVPHHDLAAILDESLNETSPEFIALLTGYGLSVADYDSIKDEISLLQLLEAVDKFRWALDKAPHRIEYYKKRFDKLSAITLSFK